MTRLKKSIEFETHFYGTAFVHEFAFIAQVTHEEKAAPATFFQTFKTGRIRYAFGIKTGAFIGYTDRKCIFLAAKGNRNAFVAISLIAVQNGVGNCFGKTDQNIAVDIWRKVIAGCYVMNKWLDFRNVIGVGR